MRCPRPAPGARTRPRRPSRPRRPKPRRPAPVRPSRTRRAVEADPWPDPFAGGRLGALRLASLHLRQGQHSLARAELEALAGRGRLDEPALLDLAEVRWRTGDLPGAGEAANTLLARGSESPLALVIAAEAVAAVGRPGEARRLSRRALQVVDGPLDPLFAGMPRALIWPVEPLGRGAGGRCRHRTRPWPGQLPRPHGTRRRRRTRPRRSPAVGRRSRPATPVGRRSCSAWPCGSSRASRRTSSERVAGRDEPLLALVRGDALRLLGREAEALAAFDLARGRSGPEAAGDRAGTGRPRAVRRRPGDRRRQSSV